MESVLVPFEKYWLIPTVCDPIFRRHSDKREFPSGREGFDVARHNTSRRVFCFGAESNFSPFGNLSRQPRVRVPRFPLALAALRTQSPIPFIMGGPWTYMAVRVCMSVSVRCERLPAASALHRASFLVSCV